MPLDDQSREYLRRAIAMATVAFSLDDPRDLWLQRGEQWMEEDPMHEVGTLVGMTQLATILLVKLERHGDDPLEVLQDVSDFDPTARSLASPTMASARSRSCSFRRTLEAATETPIAAVRR